VTRITCGKFRSFMRNVAAYARCQGRGRLISFIAPGGMRLARHCDVLLNLRKKRGLIMEGVLLQSVEGLGESPFPGELWELLQAEKETIAKEIVADGPLSHDAANINECEPWDDAEEQMTRRHRSILETRLRDLNDAQDRLFDGGYGVCSDCANRISAKRLEADPAASLCIACQQLAERELSRPAH
jgi:RNA polymerase-binding transcription factor DksA